MLQVEFGFDGEQVKIDKFVFDNFPQWDKVSDISQYRGAVSELIDQMGSVYYINLLNPETLIFCYECYGFDDDFLQETFEKLIASGMTEIYLNYADNDGEFAGYVDFSSGVMVGEEFNGGDIADVSEQLRAVLESWDTMNHLFNDDD